MTGKDLTELPVSAVKGVGPRRAVQLEKAGIPTLRDALFHVPLRYEDRTRFLKIHKLVSDSSASVIGRIVSVSVKRPKGFVIVEATVNDGTGVLRAVWFNQPYLARSLAQGAQILVTGVAKRGGRGWAGASIENPEFELLGDSESAAVPVARILPVYPLVAEIGQKQFRKIMQEILLMTEGHIRETMPGEIIRRTGLPPLAESILGLHLPAPDSDINALNSGRSPWHRRLIFEEFMLFCTGVERRRRMLSADRGIAFACPDLLQARLKELLPFRLTQAQTAAMEEIRTDMLSPAPMHRLLQGDVGSGKTVVALSAMLRAVECGYQAALMAPTEILAEQHCLSISGIAEGLGIRVELRTSSKKNPSPKVQEGPCIVIGTHALISEAVVFGRLGLVVIDEQHKFGVVQRGHLRRKGGSPDVLIMTATPIPRSLALTLYGDLDSTVMDELPEGRQPVETRCYTSEEKQEIYGMLRSEISQGRQAYVVYPVIEESEHCDLRSAIQGREGFRRVFPEFRVELVHGRMASAEREEIMDAFRRGSIDILVCTTVIEVGVDVANATVMAVIHAERFGLSQLHQLRGRVGRGAAKSLCVLVAYEPLGNDARRRLDAMVATNSGFEIAETDLEIRGPGEFLGTRQSGMPDFLVAHIVRDRGLLETARREAACMLDADPDLRRSPFFRRAVEVFWKGKPELFSIG